MTVLVIGVQGQTGRAISDGLHAKGVAVRRTSTGGGPGVTRFTWGDFASHDATLKGVRAVYLLAPPLDTAPERTMCPFIDRALAADVKRFVLLGASAVEEGDPGLGRVHRYLRDHAPEWAVLRPSWFMQNFVNPRHAHAQSLAAGEPLVTATGHGKVAFIDVHDIARVAVRLLTDASIRNRDWVLTGPEALSFDDVAAVLSEHTGRTIVHRSIAPTDLAARWIGGGMPPAYAQLLASLDERIARGTEARTTPFVEEITGERPRSLKAFVATLAR